MGRRSGHTERGWCYPVPQPAVGFDLSGVSDNWRVAETYLGPGTPLRTPSLSATAPELWIHTLHATNMSQFAHGSIYFAAASGGGGKARSGGQRRTRGHGGMTAGLIKISCDECIEWGDEGGTQENDSDVKREGLQTGGHGGMTAAGWMSRRTRARSAAARGCKPTIF